MLALLMLLGCSIILYRIDVSFFSFHYLALFICIYKRATGNKPDTCRQRVILNAHFVVRFYLALQGLPGPLGSIGLSGLKGEPGIPVSSVIKLFRDPLHLKFVANKRL